MGEKVYKIRPLVWKVKVEKSWSIHSGHYVERIHKARSVAGGLYWIRQTDESVTWNWTTSGGQYVTSDVASLEAAKSACEAHYRARLEEGLEVVNHVEA